MLKCDHFGEHLACGLCLHGGIDHKEPVNPWKQPLKICTEAHDCEVCASLVLCKEVKSDIARRT